VPKDLVPELVLGESLTFGRQFPKNKVGSLGRESTPKGGYLWLLSTSHQRNSNYTWGAITVGTWGERRTCGASKIGGKRLEISRFGGRYATLFGGQEKKGEKVP